MSRGAAPLLRVGRRRPSPPPICGEDSAGETRDLGRSLSLFSLPPSNPALAAAFALPPFSTPSRRRGLIPGTLSVVAVAACLGLAG